MGDGGHDGDDGALGEGDGVQEEKFQLAVAPQ